MNKQVQHKLNTLDIAPPETVWTAIASELDTMDSSMRYPKVLYQLAIQPPSHNWSVIRERLDEADAPATAGEKLAAMAVLPPANTWMQIEAALDNTKEKPRRAILPWWKYAAAAAIITALTWGALQITSRPDKQGLAMQDETARPTTIPVDNSATNTVATDAAAGTETGFAVPISTDDLALEESKRTVASLGDNIQTKIRAASDFYFPEPTAPHAGTVADEDNPQYQPDLSSNPSRYILLLTPEGNIIRMSKKLSNMICCVSGEEVDQACKDQIDRLREKLACTPGMHATGNFIDIVSMASSLSEENQ